MDTTYHSNIPIETLSLLDCNVRNFNFIHPINNIFFDNIDYIRKLDASGKDFHHCRQCRTFSSLPHMLSWL